MANRLYGQAGYDFQKPCLALLKKSYGAPLEPLDFKNTPGGAARRINAWVEEQTHNRIRDLIPEGALNGKTRLVLVNAIYFKAQWESKFEKEATKPAPFHGNGGTSRDVPMMMQEADFGYMKRAGFSIVTMPYAAGSDLQFVILLPDRMSGLAALESRLSATLLADCADLQTREVLLSLPKFTLKPPVMELTSPLKELGMKSAFDDPPGSADFDGIAPRKPDESLCISEVFHKTFLSLDENGTEAAAATAEDSKAVSVITNSKPVKVNVDHPFLFAIQDRKSGACLFIGRVTDPR